MSMDQVTRPDSGTIDGEISAYLGKRLDAEIDSEQDLFASGLISSMFAMELVVYLEQTYGVAVVGRDLKLDNFRSVRKMTELVLRLLADA